MKGSPRSLWLSWANRAASLWTSAATAALRRQQQATLKALTPKPPKAKPAAGQRKPRRKWP